jgi:hypothetical protein
VRENAGNTGFHGAECLGTIHQCYDRTNSRIHVTRNVTFAESLDLELQPLHPGLILNNKSQSGVNDGKLPLSHADPADDNMVEDTQGSNTVESREDAIGD